MLFIPRNKDLKLDGWFDKGGPPTQPPSCFFFEMPPPPGSASRRPSFSDPTKPLSGNGAAQRMPTELTYRVCPCMGVLCLMPVWWRIPPFFPAACMCVCVGLVEGAVCVQVRVRVRLQMRVMWFCVLVECLESGRGLFRNPDPPPPMSFPLPQFFSFQIPSLFRHQLCTTGLTTRHKNFECTIGRNIPGASQPPPLFIMSLHFLYGSFRETCAVV